MAVRQLGERIIIGQPLQVLFRFFQQLRLLHKMLIHEAKLPELRGKPLGHGAEIQHQERISRMRLCGHACLSQSVIVSGSTLVIRFNPSRERMRDG